MSKKKTVTTTEKHAGKSQVKQARVLNIVAEAQRRYLNSNSIADIYRIAAEEIQHLIVDGYTITTILDDDIQAQRLAAYCGFEGIEERVFDLLHADPREMVFPISKVPEADLRMFRSARLEYYSDGIYGLGLHKIPRAVCSTLQRFLGAGKTYTMGFLHQGSHLGGLILLPKKNISDLTWAIEMIINQAATVISQIRADIKLGRSESLYYSIFETMLNGMAYCKMIFENGIPQDFIYLDVNKSFETQTGLKDVRGKLVSDVIPGLRASDPGLFEIYGRVALTGKPEEFEIYVEALKMWFAVSVYSPRREYFVAVFDVITKRKESEERINQLNSVLSVLRDVNQLITREKDVDRLLAKTCNLMIETRGFSFSWILLLDEHYGYDHAAATSRLNVPDSFLEDMKKGIFPPCVARLLKQAQPFAVCDDIVKLKMQCLGENQEIDGTGLISRLEYEGKIYGIIAVYVPRQMARDAEEQSLFKELAEDLGFALHGIEAEERKRQMVESLRAAEERYHSTLDNMLEGCQIIDFGWRYVYLNDSAVRHSRKSRAELLGNNMIDVFPGIENSAMFTCLRECMYNRVPRSVESEFFYADGSKGIFELRIEPVPEGVFILSHDITGQIDAEKKLKTSEEQYRLLVETADEGIIVTQNGNFKFVNRRMAQILGYSKEELLSRHFMDTVHPDDREKVLERHKKRISGDLYSDIFPFRVIDKSGNTKWVEVNVVLVDWEGKPATLTLLKDITRRRQAEHENEISRHFLEIANRHNDIDSLLQEFVSEVGDLTGCEAIGIRSLDSEGNIPYKAYKGFSKAFYDSESQLSVKSDHCICINVIKGTTDPALSFYTGYGSFYMNGTTRFLATVSEDDKGETRNVCNAAGYESVALIPIKSDNGIIGLIHVADTRENMVPPEIVKLLEHIASALGMGIRRAVAEIELRDSNERFKRISAITSDIAYSCTADPAGDYRIDWISGATERILGYTVDEIKSQRCWRFLVIEEDTAVFEQNVIGILPGQQQSCELRLRAKGGEIVWISSHAECRAEPDSPATYRLFGGLADITERKKLEKEGKDYTQRLKSTVEGAINSLAYIAETRDPYTAGHQQRVTRLALAIAEELGLSEDKIETVRVAGILHDIGKVQVPAEILSKPTTLSTAEIQLIRCHPSVSYDIVKTIDMPWPAADIVLQHHERMNGSGYPKSLAGDDIIFEARILAVADVVEAMASHRPYRPAVGIDQALEEISGNRGTLYDEKVVDACLRLFREKHFEI